MGWKTRQVEVPVKFGIHSLTAYALDEDNLPPLTNRITSLRPKTSDERRIDLEFLRQFGYFGEFLIAHNQRRFFGRDISDYTYIAEPFNQEYYLEELIDKAGIPLWNRDQILDRFRQLEQGIVPSTGGNFSIMAEERHHPVVSRLASGIKYVTVPSGALVYGVGGFFAGGICMLFIEDAVSFFSGNSSMNSYLTTIGAALVGVASFAYGAFDGAKFGYSLQDRVTGNHK